MCRKFEIKSQNTSVWLNHMERIATFCDLIGIEADQAQKPLTLQLVIYPEETKCNTAKLLRLPIN